MLKVSVCRDMAKCRELWQRFQPEECVFDLWMVRSCFARHYDHPAEFYLAEENGETAGMLPLSWIEETGRYGFFPGELWKGRTWLEQNRITASGPAVAKALLESVPGPMQLRYILPGCEARTLQAGEGECGGVDEIGYLFSPGEYQYSFDLYLNAFSTRSRKKLAREQASLEAHGIRYRFDHFPDIEKLFQMNLAGFGSHSYFHDRRFLNSFLSLAEHLTARGLLRITTLLIGNEVAAVDMGALWKSVYTVLAGGTNPEFPGAAKIINFQHIKWACRERLSLVDFLCGDFGWKRRFRLQPRPLYMIDSPAAARPGEKTC